MRQLGMQGVHRRRCRKTTVRAAEAAPAPDLAGRNFKATRPNEHWLADITYIRTWEGWLYLAAVIDVRRRVVGWAMGDSLHRVLVIEALTMAVQQRRPEGRGIRHSGSYGSGLTRFLRRMGHIIVEVSRPPRKRERRLSGKSDPN